MKKTRLTPLICLFFILATAGAALAQTPLDYTVQEWERAKAYTKEVLEVMPESAYGDKPTPEIRSFAAQMLHITGANYGFGAAATGQEIPAGMGEIEKTTDLSKANVTKLVLEGYDFIINGIKKMSPSQFNEQVNLFGRFELTRQQALDKNFEHQTHHRGQTIVYLRLAGVTPPQEKLF